MDDRFREFCVNEEARVRRFSEKLQQAGFWHRAMLMREIADKLAKLAGESEAA